MHKNAKDTRADILICSEPNKALISRSEWHTDADMDVGVLATGNARTNLRGKGKGFAWIQLKGFTVFSCYISPNATDSGFTTFIADLRAAIRGRGPCLIVGDFNSKHRIWGSKRTDRRGTAIAEWAAADTLTIHNCGTTPTFRRNKQESYIDLTLSTPGVAPLIQNWKVDDESESLSDHNYITMQVATVPTATVDRPKLRFRAGKAQMFAESLGYELQSSPQSSPDDFAEIVERTCTRIFRAPTCRKYPPVSWWNVDIERARRETIKARRSMKRAIKKNRADIPELIDSYKAKKRLLRSTIRRGKEAAFDDLLSAVNADPWGSAYKIATSKCHPRSTLDEDGQMVEVRKMFPNRPLTTWARNPPGTISPFTLEELEAAAKRVKCGKAAGPDGLSGEMVSITLRTQPEATLEAFNRCLNTSTFPARWKVASLVLIPKARKPGTTTPTYRPICLLSQLGKTLETLIATRLGKHLWPRLYPLQFGFRPGASTTDAVQAIFNNSRRTTPEEIVVLIALDIKNAFNSAPWDRIVCALRKLHTPEDLVCLIESYFAHRYLLVGTKMTRLSCGVPQGSVLGPILWNAFYNEVVSLELPGSTIVAFADDIGIIVRGSNLEYVQLAIEVATLIITNKLAELQIELAPDKTEAVILHAPTSINEITFQVGNHNVTTGHAIKYLGVWIERALHCKKHIEEISAKAERQVHGLSRLLNPRGPVVERVRRLYAAVILSSVSYASRAWYPLVRTKADHRKLESASRLIYLRSIGAPSSTSTVAVEVIARQPPISLRLAAQYDPRAQMRPADGGMAARWQQLWDENPTGKGGWTRRLIPQLKPWISRGHGEVDRYLGQLLSGHGVVRQKRKQLGMTRCDMCPTCRVVDTPEHAFFSCCDGQAERGELERLVGVEIGPDSVVAAMLGSQEAWTAVQQMARAVVERREERSRDGF